MAGLTPDMARLGVDALNAGVLAYLNGGPLSPFLDRRSGPVWFRGYVSNPAPDACARLEEALQIWGRGGWSSATRRRTTA